MYTWMCKSWLINGSCSNVSYIPNICTLMRVIKSVPVRTESAPLFIELNILSVLKFIWWNSRFRCLNFIVDKSNIPLIICSQTYAMSMIEIQCRHLNNRKEFVKKSFRERAAKIGLYCMEYWILIALQYLSISPEILLAKHWWSWCSR